MGRYNILDYNFFDRYRRLVPWMTDCVNGSCGLLTSKVERVSLANSHRHRKQGDEWNVSTSQNVTRERPL